MESAKVVRRGFVAAALAAALLAAAPQPGHAATLLDSAGSCLQEPIQKPFLRWKDSADYRLVPGGAFEKGDVAWTGRKARYSAPATRKDSPSSPRTRGKYPAGNEPWYVHGWDDVRSLLLPAGSHATSHAVCVGAAGPAVRFFARASETSARSSLSIELLFEDADGQLQKLDVASLRATKGWDPTPAYRLSTDMPALPSGEATAVKLRFKPVGPAKWWIDDVYVDPAGL